MGTRKTRRSFPSLFHKRALLSPEAVRNHRPWASVDMLHIVSVWAPVSRIKKGAVGGSSPNRHESKKTNARIIAVFFILPLWFRVLRGCRYRAAAQWFISIFVFSLYPYLPLM
jgi:hypothetical protein